MYRKYRKYCLIVFIIILSLLIFQHRKSSHAVTVAVCTAKLSPIARKITVIGDILAEQGVDVSTKSNGVIKNIYFQSGQFVKKGDLLVSFENDDIQAMLDQSTAKLNLAKQDYERYAMLVKRGDISHAEFDKTAAQFSTMQAEVNYETALLNQTLVRAPFDGKLGLKKINIGQYVSQGAALVNLQAMSPLYVDFNVPEQYANQVHANETVELVSDDAENVLAKGKVSAIDASLNHETRTLAVRALIDNSASTILSPGMYVQVNLMLTQSANAILIPQSAIVYSPLGEYVYQSSHHRVQQIKVETGERFHDDVVILSGVKQDDQIVCAGQIKLHPHVTTREVPYQS